MRIAFLLVLMASLAKAGNVPVISFSQLEEILQKKDDTLRVVNFWATWCKPCVEELPHFEKLNQTYKDKPVKVILVSLDFKDKLPMVKGFVERKGIKSSVLLLDQGNPNEWIDKISSEWSGAIPATLFVRAKTSTRKFHEGDYDYETLEKQIQQLLTL